jgi:polysaccharide export outer membrane protein|tara:strand:- start:5009 stop:6814 length:1806 start_codon:yes stop_codon:yes gene_type:complete
MSKCNLKNKYIFLPFLLFLIPLKGFAKITDEQKMLLEGLPPDQRASIIEKMDMMAQAQGELDEIFEDPNTLIRRPELDADEEEDKCPECIYGYNFFEYAPTTFAPTESMPISSDYVLGPGDMLEIFLYGNDEDEATAFISRTGEIFVPYIGPVNLLGLTFEQANELLKTRVAAELIGTEISIALKELRSITVYFLGEAYKPGQYKLSALSTVTNAMFASGGVNKNGSLRNIQVLRNNKLIANYDFYEFLLKGRVNSDVKLQDGDVIFIPFIENKVKVGGAFRRPGLYEFKENETVKDAIYLAGGFNEDVAPNTPIERSSINSETFTREVAYLNGESGLSTPLANSDVINVSGKSGLEPRTITVTGQVNRPGDYSIQQGDNILDIINRAGGYTEDSYSEGSVFLRKNVALSQKKAFERSADELENTIIEIITQGTANLSEGTIAPLSALITKLRNTKPLGRMVVDVDYLDLKTNSANNFLVEEGDSLHIPRRPNSISVVGEVLNSSTIVFQPKLSVNNYLDLAGGLNNAADKNRIFVIYPDGKSKLIKRSFFSSQDNLLPGSTIVVPRDSRPFDAIKITQIITPILADLATSAAAIAAISND